MISKSSIQSSNETMPMCQSAIKGCGFEGDTVQLQNLILSCFVGFFSFFQFTTSSLISLFYIRYKDDAWSFTSICTFELLQINILGSLFGFLMAYSFCDPFMNTNRYLCVAQNCFGFFILLMTFKVNFNMALARLYRIQFNKILSRSISFKVSQVLTILLVILYTFSPAYLNWNEFRDDCDCHNIRTLPDVYILISNILMITIGVMTSMFYLSIYAFVKSKRQSVNARAEQVSNGPAVTAESDTISSSANNVCQQRTKNKLEVLKAQTIIFFILIVAYFPYLILSTMKVVLEWEEDKLVTNLLKYSSVVILIDTIGKPVLYTYRLNFMKKLYRKT